MSIKRRLERLEERRREATEWKPRENARLWERLFHAFENGRRELQGLELLPDLPRTEEDIRLDIETLEETIPSYRESRGYQQGEGKAFLDQRQQEDEERLKGDKR